MAVSVIAGLSAAIGAAGAAGALTGFGAFFGFLATTAGMTAFALGAGLSVISRALAPKPSLGNQMRGITQTTREPAGSRKLVYGQMRVGGQVVFLSHSGDDNKYLHLAIAFASHEIESYEEIWFNDKQVWTSSGGFQSDWGTYVTIDRKFGTASQAASTQLVNANVLWTTNHKLSGIAYIAFKLEWNQDKFPQGVPNITAVIKGKKVYDPRDTNQSASDSTTWTYSTNPALCLRDYLVDEKYGLGEDRTLIDETVLDATADLCDETQEGGVDIYSVSGQKRYTLNGVIDTRNSVKDNIEQLLSAMGGRLTFSGGKYFIEGSEYKTPTVTLDESVVISEIQTQTKQSRRGIYNGVKGIFVSEEKNYKVLDYPAQISSTYATEDGDPIYLDMPLPFVTNNLQAQLLAKIALLKSRQQTTIAMTVNLTGLKLKVGDTVMVTNSRLGYSSKVFEVIDYTLANSPGGELGVQLQLIETASAVYDWTSSDEEDFLKGGELDLYDGRTVDNVTSLTGTEIGLRGPDGGVSSSIELSWTAPDDAFVEFYSVRYNKNGTTEYFEVETKETNILLSGLDITSNYDFRVQAQNLLGVRSTGTSITNRALNGDTTAPSAPTGVTLTAGINQITCEWTNPTDIDLAFVEVHVTTTSATPSVSATPTAKSPGEEYIATGLSEATRYFHLRAVDYSGNKSAYTTQVSATSLLATSSDIADGAVDTDQIATDAITEVKIEDGAVTADKITVNELSAISADVGAITAGTLQAGGSNAIPDANDSPSGSETGAFIDLDNGKFVFGDANKHLLYDGSTLLVKGELEADILDVIDATITGQLTANAISAGAVTVASLSAGVFAEFDDRYGTSGGFYVTDTDEFFDGNSTKYVSVGTVAHSTDDIYFECRLIHSWSWPRNDTGDKLKANVSFEYSTDNNTWTTVPSSTTQVATATGVVAQYATLYNISEDITYTMTGSALTAGNYYFRVKIVAQNSTNAFQLAAFGSGSGVPIAFEVQESSGLSAAGGNADTLDGLDSTQFLRSDASDTLTGDLTITGNLTVQGTQTTLDTATLQVEDKNITLNYGTGDTSGSANGAGITIQDAVSASSDAFMNWNATHDLFNFSHSATFGYTTIDPDSFLGTSGGFGNIADGSGWSARGLYIQGGGTGDAAAIGHNGVALYFGIQNGSTANSMDTWLTVNPTKIANFAAQVNVSGHGNSSQWNTAYTYSQVGHLPLSGGTITGNLTRQSATTGTAFIKVDNTATGTSNYAAFQLDSDYNHSVKSGIYLNSNTNTAYAGANALHVYQYHNLPIGFVTNNTLRMTVLGDGNVSINSTDSHEKLYVNGSIRADGAYKVGGSTVITSSRNLTNIGTISSGAITSSGIVSGTAFVGGLYAGATGAPDARIWAVSADYPNYGIFYDEGNPDYIDFRWNGVDKLKINMENGLVNSVTGFQVNGTDVINSSRNLVNIGTLTAAGTITSNNRLVVSRSTSSTTEPTATFNSGTGGQPYAFINTYDPYHGIIMRGLPAAATTYGVNTGNQMSFVEYGGDFRFYTKTPTALSQDAQILAGVFDGEGIKVNGTQIVDASRNLTNVVNFTNTHLITNRRTTAFAPNDSAAGIRLEYSSGDASGDIGSGIVFAQRWWSGATSNVRTGGIAGFKGAGSGSFGGGLKFYTQPQSGADMNVVLTLDRTQNATFANNVAVGNDLIINGTTRINSAGVATLGTTTTGALTATNISATSLSLSGTFSITSVAATSTVSGSQFRASYGSVSAPAFTFKNDDDTGMWSAGGDVKFAVGGSNRMTIGASATTVSGRISVVGDLQAGSVPQTIITTGRALQNVTSVSSSGNIVATSGFLQATSGDVIVGTYSTTATGSLYLTGSTANKQARLFCSNGNLHMDANSGNGMYLNYYNGTVIYFGSGASGSNASITAAGNFTTTGSVALNSDAAQLQLGSGNRAQIFHNSAGLYLRTSTGGVYAQADSFVHYSANAASTYFSSAAGGLSFNNTQFLTSARNLVNIGTISSGSITASGSVNLGTTTDGSRRFKWYNDNNHSLYYDSNLLTTQSADVFTYWENVVFRHRDSTNAVTISGSSGDISAGAITSSGDVKLNGNAKKYAAPVYRDVVTGISNSGYTTLFTVDGGGLASTIKMTLGGTTGSVVVNVTADISVNHYQDILITSQSGFYTTVTLRVISNNNEDFAVQATTNHANSVNLTCEVFPLNNELVTFTTSHSFTGKTHDHTCYYGTHTSGTGGNDGDLTVNGRTFLQDGIISSPALTFRNDHNTGLYRVGSDALGWVVGGSRKFYTSSTRAYFQNLSEGVDVPSLRISGTTVIDSSRNLTNIGTISSGQITSSGSVTAGNGSTSLGYYVGTTQIVQGSTRNLVNIGTITAGLTKLTPSGYTDTPQGLAALNIGRAGGGETRAIDIWGAWSSGESKSITFNHGTSSSQMVGQINVAYQPSSNSVGSSFRWGKLYHGGDSSQYVMELHSENTSYAYLDINRTMVNIGQDATYTANYGVIGFGGRTNGYNRVFGRTDTNDGLFLAAATGRNVFVRANGEGTDRLTLGFDGSYASYSVVGFGSNVTNGYNRIFAHPTQADGIYINAATGRGIEFRTNGSGSQTFRMDASGNFQVAGTTVIDSSRNLTNIGTISSGGITALTANGSTTAPNVVLTIQANTSSTITTGGGTAIKFKGVSSGGNIQNYDQAMIASVGQSTNNAHGLDFYYKPDGSTALTKAFTILPNGNSLARVNFISHGYVSADGLVNGASLQVGNTEIVSSTRRFYASDGTSVKAAYSFNGDSTTGMIHPATSRIGFIANATDALQMNNSREIVIGGNFTNNHYNSVSRTRLSFGGGNDLDNYFIGTTMENYGGNYTKLDLRWHTGIRMGAQPNYGGIRFFNNEDLGSLIFSIGKGDANTRVEGNNKLIFGPNATWGKFLKIGGDANNSDANSASIGTTNGNLHIDAALGAYGTYLNFYDGTAGVYIGNGASGIVSHFNTSGHLNLAGTGVSASGYALSVGSTGVIDTSRNLSNIGTAIFNGAVTMNSSLNVASTIGIAGTTVIDNNRRILAADGAVNVPYITFAADTDTGIYRPAANQLAFSTGGTKALEILSNNTVIATSKIISQGGHADARIAIEYRHGGAVDHVNNGDLLLWASEPGITYDCVGIGANINHGGQYYGRADNNNAYGLYQRFHVNNGLIEWWSTTGSAGTAGGQGTRRMKFDTAGNLDLLTGGLEIGSVLVVNSSRSLVNINTISSGQITSSGSVTAGSASNTLGFYCGTTQVIQGSSRNLVNIGTGSFSGKVDFQGDAAIEGGSGYGLFKGYSGNNNHFITSRASVTGSTSSPTITGGHQTTLVEYCNTTDTSGFYFKASDTGTYTEIARITRAGITSIGNVTAYSDAKLKKNVETISGALEKVRNMRGVTYERVDDDSGERQMGVIAQEVEAAGVTEVVKYDEENDVKSVAYGNMVGLMIEALKEANDKIDLLTKRIEELENGDN